MPSIMVIIIGNGIGDLISDPGQVCILLWKNMIAFVLTHLHTAMVNSRAD